MTQNRFCAVVAINGNAYKYKEHKENITNFMWQISNFNMTDSCGKDFHGTRSDIVMIIQSWDLEFEYDGNGGLYFGDTKHAGIAGRTGDEFVKYGHISIVHQIKQA